jgi:hypothetical protein
MNMNKGSLRRALVLSLLLSVVFPVAYMVLFVKGVEYDPPLDQTTFSKLSHDEQANIVEKRARPISGLQFIVSNSGHPYFWLEYAKLMAFGFVFALLVSVSILLWEQKALRSNPALNPDAQKRRAG